MTSKEWDPNNWNEDVWEDSVDSQYPEPLIPTEPFLPETVVPPPLSDVAVPALFGNPIWTHLMELPCKGRSHYPCYFYTHTGSKADLRIMGGGGELYSKTLEEKMYAQKYCMTLLI